MQYTSRMPRLATAAVLALFASSHLLTIAIPSEREYDEGVYLLSARSLAGGHSLFTSVFSSQPPAFLESLALAFRVGGDGIVTGRLLILAFAILALLAVGDLARRVAAGLSAVTEAGPTDGEAAGPDAPAVDCASMPAWAGVAAAAALALTSTFGGLAHFVQAETPAVALALAALVVALAGRERRWQPGRLFAAGALFALACLFKLLVVPMAAPLGLLLLLAPADEPREAWRIDGGGLRLLAATARRSAWVAAGAVVVVGVVLLRYDTAALYRQAIGFHLAKHAAYTPHPLANLRRTLRVLGNDWGISASAVAGVAVLWSRGRLVAGWVLVWLLAAVAVVITQTPLFWRHFVLFWPPLAIAAALLPALLASRPSATVAGRAGGRQRIAIATALAVALWACVSLQAHGPRSEDPADQDGGTGTPASRAALAATVRWIASHTRPGELVAGDDPMAIYVARRNAPPALCDTSMARIVSGWLTLDEASAATGRARVVVLRRAGRLSRLAGYPGWLEAHYEKQRFVGAGASHSRTFWVRRPTPQAGS